VNQHLHWYLHFLEYDLLELIINKGNVKFLEIRPLKGLIINRGNVKFLEIRPLKGLIISRGNVKFLEIRPLKGLIISRGNVKFGLPLSLFNLKMGYLSCFRSNPKKCEAFTMVPVFCFTQSCAHFFNTRQLGLLYRTAACTTRISAFFGGMGSTSPFHST
jgi:hypothetical protein